MIDHAPADRATQVQDALARLRDAADAVGRRLTFMEVCGTHTMSAFRTGLHSLMPPNVTLLSGPGCPVCVTAQSDIDLLIALAAECDVTLCTYGDMLRVPGRRGSLERVRGRGADVRVIYSALDAVRLAEAEPQREVVLGALGFETTAPTAAAAVLEARRRGLTNFSVLASHKRVVPAMLALLAGGQMKLDGFLCPGHVAVIIGSEAYRPVVEQYAMPCVIGGFEETLIAPALAALGEQVRAGVAELVNLYPQAVTPEGNRVAQAMLDEVYEPADVRWRGLGVIPESGLAVRKAYASFDAVRRFGLTPVEDREPKGCICGQVLTGQATPPECELFGTVCTPIQPIGPCMVSSEGTCQAWFKYKRGRAASAARTMEVAR